MDEKNLSLRDTQFRGQVSCKQEVHNTASVGGMKKVLWTSNVELCIWDLPYMYKEGAASALDR